MLSGAGCLTCDRPYLLFLALDGAAGVCAVLLVLRGKIESGEYRQGDILPYADLAHEYDVSIRVTYSALAMLAANRYVIRPEACASYCVIWQAEI